MFIYLAAVDLTYLCCKSTNVWSHCHVTNTILCPSFSSVLWHILDIIPNYISMMKIIIGHYINDIIMILVLIYNSLCDIDFYELFVITAKIWLHDERASGLTQLQNSACGCFFIWYNTKTWPIFYTNRNTPLPKVF